MINSLKGSITRKVAKNQDFSVILYHFIGFLMSKILFSRIFPHICRFRAKYYIKPPKNHWRLNSGNCLTDIRNLGELDMDYFSNNGTQGQQNVAEWPKIRSQRP